MTEAANVTITLPDGASKSVPAGTTVADFVRTQIGPGLAKAALFAKFDGAPVDLSRPLEHGGKLAILTAKNPEALDLVRHDAAHIVASVVQRLFPGTQVTIGPTTDEGFYYDFARDKPFTPEDLDTIEKAANDEIKADHPFVRKEVTREEALALFGKLGEKFKVEIIEDIFAQGREDVDAVLARRLGRLLSRTPRPVDRARRRDQAAVGRGCVLARRSSQRTAPAHLRHRVLHAEGARRLDDAAGGGAQARPPQARQGARPVRVPSGRARRGVLDRKGHDDLHAAVGGDAPVCA